MILITIERRFIKKMLHNESFISFFFFFFDKVKIKIFLNKHIIQGVPRNTFHESDKKMFSTKVFDWLHSATKKFKKFFSNNCQGHLRFQKLHFILYTFYSIVARIQIQRYSVSWSWRQRNENFNKNWQSAWIRWQ